MTTIGRRPVARLRRGSSTRSPPRVRFWRSSGRRSTPPRRRSLPSPRAPHAQRPGQVAQQHSRALEVGLGEVGEVLRAQHAGRAPRADGARGGGRAWFDAVDLDPERRPRRRRRDHPRALAEREQRQSRRRRPMRAKEQGKRLVEPRQIRLRDARAGTAAPRRHPCRLRTPTHSSERTASSRRP